MNRIKSWYIGFCQRVVANSWLFVAVWLLQISLSLQLLPMWSWLEGWMIRRSLMGATLTYPSLYPPSANRAVALLGGSGRGLPDHLPRAICDLLLPYLRHLDHHDADPEYQYPRGLGIPKRDRPPSSGSHPRNCPCGISCLCGLSEAKCQDPDR